MTKTIFNHSFLLGISVLLLCAALFFGIQYTQIKQDTYEGLQQEAVYVERGLNLNGESYLSALDQSDNITWINSRGEVLFDSESELPVENQSACEEVIAALETGEGHSMRRSSDSGESTMYYARLCADGTVIRLSRSLSAMRYALEAVSPVMWVLVLVLLISGVLSFRAAKEIVRPINELDLDRPDAEIYRELSPLVEKLREQRLTIQEEVSQREEMRREFSANVSHELKTPLTSISGFAELMAEGVVPAEKVQEFSQDIYKESQRLMALIDDIIKISRLDENAEGPERESVDLYELANDVLDSLQPVAERQNVSLSLTGVHAEVQGVYRLLTEMVYNLCDNAVKYNRPGGSVTVNVSFNEKGTLFTVTDTGIGIPKEHQKRVFERFYRVDKSHSKEIGGTGLGLSIVKHGALFHGASVDLESEPGNGTRISLFFPDADKNEA